MLTNSLHGSHTLLFEDAVARVMAYSVWTATKWSDAEGAADTMYYDYGNAVGYGGTEFMWNLSTPTFYVGVNTLDWGGFFNVTDILPFYNWGAYPAASIAAPFPTLPPPPSSPAERAVIYAGCVMNPAPFGAAPNESSKGFIQARLYSPTVRTTKDLSVPISPGPPVGLNGAAAFAINTPGCVNVAKEQ